MMNVFQMRIPLIGRNNFYVSSIHHGHATNSHECLVVTPHERQSGQQKSEPSLNILLWGKPIAVDGFSLKITSNAERYLMPCHQRICFPVLLIYNDSEQKQQVEFFLLTANHSLLMYNQLPVLTHHLQTVGGDKGTPICKQPGDLVIYIRETSLEYFPYPYICQCIYIYIYITLSIPSVARKMIWVIAPVNLMTVLILLRHGSSAVALDW